MRKVTGKYWLDGQLVDFEEGFFHGFFADYEEFEEGPGNFTMALVELPTGQVVSCIPTNIAFLEQPEQKEQKVSLSEDRTITKMINIQLTLEHMLAEMMVYLYRRDKQELMQVTHIQNLNTELFRLVKEEGFMYEELLSGAFIRACYNIHKDAILEEDSLPKSIPSGWTVDNLSDHNFIDEFLRIYATTEKVRQYFLNRR